MTLDELAIGKKSRIIAVHGQGTLRDRLLAITESALATGAWPRFQPSGAAEGPARRLLVLLALFRMSFAVLLLGLSRLPLDTGMHHLQSAPFPALLLAQIGPVDIRSEPSGGQAMHKVWLGPFSDVAALDAASEKLQGIGVRDPRPTID